MDKYLNFSRTGQDKWRSGWLGKVNAWYRECKKNEIPYVTVDARRIYCDIEWDYINLSAECSAILLAMGDKLRDAFEALYTKYANNKSNARISCTVVKLFNIERKHAKACAEEIYDLVSSVIPKEGGVIPKEGGVMRHILINTSEEILEARGCPYCPDGGVLVSDWLKTVGPDGTYLPPEKCWKVVKCIVCGCQGPMDMDEAQAIKKWNDRPTVPPALLDRWAIELLATGANILKAMEIADNFKRSGILFVPVPALNADDYQQLLAETLARTETITGDAVGTCRVCGCTDDDCSGCIERTGEPCHWVEDDLCSACVPREGGDEQ